jgi:hypothetical protein
MTNPPQGSDAQGDDERTDAASRPVPESFVTQPAPAGEPPPATPAYGQRPPSYGAPAYGQQAQSYGQPAPQYGEPAQPTPPYGQPYGQAPQAPGTGTPYGQPPYGQPAPQYGGPPYGGPPYGTPPYGQPAEKSKVGLIALVTGIALLVIAGVVVLVMSLQSTVLDPAAVERDVAAQFQQREGVAIELNCPDDMEVSANATYECTGTTADGESVTLQIAIADENTAAYTWTEP